MMLNYKGRPDEFRDFYKKIFKKLKEEFADNSCSIKYLKEAIW